MKFLISNNKETTLVILSFLYCIFSCKTTHSSSKVQKTDPGINSNFNDSTRYSYVIEPHKNGTFGFTIVSKFHDETGQKKDFLVPDVGASFIPRGATELGFKTREEAEKMAKYYAQCRNKGFRDPELLLSKHIIDSLGLTSSYSQSAYLLLPNK